VSTRARVRAHVARPSLVCSALRVASRNSMRKNSCASFVCTRVAFEIYFRWQCRACSGSVACDVQPRCFLRTTRHVNFYNPITTTTCERNTCSRKTCDDRNETREGKTSATCAPADPVASAIFAEKSRAP
jgi:hypothetical protein